MGFLEDRAIRKFSKVLALHMEPGERIIDWDSGGALIASEAPGERVTVTLIATTRGVWLVYPGGDTSRFPYRHWVSIGARGTILSWGLGDGREFLVDFGRSARDVVAAVTPLATAQMQQQQPPT
jgi:hypothetical protein